MVTALSEFIEQVGMIKGIPKHKYHLLTPYKILS